MNAIHHSENIYIFKFTVSTKILGSTAVFNTYNNRTFFLSTITISNQIKSNQITFIVTSPQHKCLGEWNSYERAPDSAEKQQTIYLWTDSAEKQQTIYLWTDSAKKQQTIYIWTDSAKKNCTGAFTVLQTVQKNTTTAIYIWTDSAKKQQQFTIYNIRFHFIFYL